MPIIDLPLEIVDVIFEAIYTRSPQVQIHNWDYWPWLPNPYEKIPKIKEHPLLDVMLVTSTWYLLIVQNPILWTHVVLESDMAGASRRRWLTPALACIERSRSSPLNITILMKSDTLSDARMVLEGHSDRWRMLSIFPVKTMVSGYDAENGFHALFSGIRLPRLLSFNFWGTVRSTEQRRKFFRLGFVNPVFIGAPALTTLSLPWFTGEITVSATPLLPKITTLKLSCRKPANLHHVLPNPAALQSLCIVIDKKMDYFCNVDLPNLSHLRVAFWDTPNTITRWLDCLLSLHRFPKLESLSIIMPGRYTRKPLPSLLNIHSLEWIESPVGDAASFQGILAACPNLHHLACIPLRTMYDNDMSIDLSVVIEVVVEPFQLLGQVDAQTGEFEYCPRLRTLCVEGYQVEMDRLLDLRPMLRLCAWDRRSWTDQGNSAEGSLPMVTGL